MCGFAGFVGQGNAQDLERMIGEIRYRGPDDTGIYHAGDVGLAHARLSIIDISPLGHQPMWNATRSVAIVFNGEIYNFLELKKKLVRAGKTFVSNSDTEVIIALYEKYGEECFAKLSGMFAIALYDFARKKLLLARDMMGKKPLYYSHTKDALIFASEPKAILAHPRVSKELNLTAANAYFALDYVPTPLSIYKNIAKLEPGTLLVYENGALRKSIYRSPDFRETKISFTEALRELEDRLLHATSARLISDVPLGVFLSGGLDSSAVAYYASRAKEAEGERIHTFSIGFKEASFDESRYAKEVAEHLNTIHHHKMLSAQETLDIIPHMFTRLDEPLADASIIPTHLLSRFAKEHVTVALGGDGGDELFAGYPTFQAEKFAGMYQSLPRFLRNDILGRMADTLPATDANFGLKFKVQKFLEGANETNIARRHMRWLGTFSQEDRSKLLMPDLWNAINAENTSVHADSYFSECGADDELNRLLWVYQRTYMMDQVMVKVDRASMFASLEARAPFLDYALVEFANQLPYEYKLHGFTTKYILKKLMEGKLPQGIIHRRKKGFGVPVAAWLRGPLKGWAEELLFATDPQKEKIFNPAYIRTLWVEHQSRKRDHRKKLWNILVFLEWQKRFL